MKKRILVIAICLLSLSLQSGRAQENNYHSGNKLRLTFSNLGRVNADDNPAVEWPIGTGHEYANVLLPVVAVQEGSNQQIAAFTFNSGFSGDGRAAMSHLPATWPAEWNDQWNGRRGPGKLNADQESYIVLEDADKGLRLTIRGWQWAHFLAQDMVFWYYELTNVGTKTYDAAAFGFVAEPDAGGDSDADVLLVDRERQIVTAVDPDNTGKGRGVARDIGFWSPVGRFSVGVLETPSNSIDGLDNDNDGLVDESRSDGIDNDGDWNPETDDVGADGIAETNDEGEGDGVPTPGEPNFDLTDIDESDEIGLTSIAFFPRAGLNVTSASELWDALTPERFDATTPGAEVIMGSGNFTLAPGETQRFSVVVFLSVTEIDQQQNENVVEEIVHNNYQFPLAPPCPKVTAVPLNDKVTLYWDNGAETAPDFEGYKIYRSSDPGFNDVFVVTNDRGVPIYSKTTQVFDLDNNVSKLFGLQVDGFRYFLGSNTGLKHWWTDTDVTNGKTYYYAVVAYTRGDVAKRQFPAENTKSIVVEADGTIITDTNTAVVTPRVETSVFQSSEYSIEHTSGIATGNVEVEVVDRTRLREGGRYQLVFDDTSGNETTYSLFDVTNPANPVPVFQHSNNFSTDEVRNDADPIFDGLHTFIFDDELAWDSLSTTWKIGNSNWDIQLLKNSNLGTPELEAVDYEVRFGDAGADTALFTTPIPVPFQVWNVTENKRENILVLDQNSDGAWSPDENIFIVTGNTITDFRPVKWTISFVVPAENDVAPQPGDVAFIRTFKPFANDIFTIMTKAISAQTNVEPTVLNDIAVVPNPYVVNSTFEQRSLYSGGQLVRKLQFIHLPQTCTIRIFDLRGRLIDTLHHNSTLDDGTEFWNMQTDDNDVVAYGIYIFHVDAPGIGETIGRFAIIR